MITRFTGIYLFYFIICFLAIVCLFLHVKYFVKHIYKYNTAQSSTAHILTNTWLPKVY